MKTTVFIPAIPRSFNNLSNIIEIYNNGILKPDEIIINASMVDSNNAKLLMALIQDNVKVFTSYHKIDAGTNRQMASYLAHGDIILYQDDDDVPSNRRVEIVKYFFEKWLPSSTVMCLVHGYVYNQELLNIDDINIDNIQTVDSGILYKKYFPNGKLEECRNITDAFGGGFSFPVCAGPVCIRKEVLDSVRWKGNNEITLCKYGSVGKGEDYDFCMEVLHVYNSTLLINIPLYNYLK